MDFGLFLPAKRAGEEEPPLEEADRRFFLEFLLVVAIIGVLLALSLQEYRAVLTKAMLVEAFFATQTAKADAIVHHAATGRWPHQQETEISGKYLSAVRWSGDSLVSEFTLPGTSAHENSPWTVSFVPATNRGPASVVAWLCGGAEPPPGMMGLADSRTTAPGYALPFTCRPRRSVDE